MADTFYIKQGEQFTSGEFTLKGKNQSIQDLSPTGTVVKVYIRERETGIYMVNGRTCTITSAINGKITISFLTADTVALEPGYFMAEFEVAFPNQDKIYFPDDREGFLVELEARVTA